ncbi:hypothetical protein MTR67_017748, partial [Solanum verrucosum]
MERLLLSKYSNFKRLLSKMLDIEKHKAPEPRQGHQLKLVPEFSNESDLHQFSSLGVMRTIGYVTP